MKFTSALLAGTCLLMGVHGCEHCHPSEDTVESPVSKDYDQSGLVYAQPYGDNYPVADLNSYSYDEPEYVFGAVDEDISPDSSTPESYSSSSSSSFLGNGQKQQDQQSSPENVINNLLGTDLPFPTNSALSSIGASLLTSVVPTGAAEQSSFFAAVSNAIPTETSAKSEFIASITSKIGGATDVPQFSSAIAGVLADVTSAASASASETSTASSSGTEAGIASGSAAHGQTTTEAAAASVATSTSGAEKVMVAGAVVMLATVVIMCSVGYVL
ncbi:hypothetical protein BDD12DRAFT_378464 [Trichophaea hybrida]|nr:hypothetical protein BDD12DRAFT_378464 [Trichophaea hybrida]